MHPHVGSVVAVLIALTWTEVAAQETACSLLTSGDIETITGSKAREPHKNDMVVPGGKEKDQTMLGCMWGVTDQGMISVALMAAPKGAAREAGLATITHAYDELKAKHWTEEKKDFAGGSCSAMTPPPADKDAPILSQCFAETRGKVVAVAFMSPTKKLSIDETKALLDEAIGRMR